MLQLKVNGQQHTLDIDPDTPLLWALRDHLNLCGTKYGCGIGLCGSCTVHIDERAERAWEALQVPQCGYCQPGMIMASVALLREKPQPTDADIDAAITNICRCGTYNRVRQAIHAAAKKSGADHA